MGLARKDADGTEVEIEEFFSLAKAFQGVSIFAQYISFKRAHESNAMESALKTSMLMLLKLSYFLRLVTMQVQRTNL